MDQHICGYTVRLTDPDQTLVCHVDKDVPHQVHRVGFTAFQKTGEDEFAVWEFTLLKAAMQDEEGK